MKVASTGHLRACFTVDDANRCIELCSVHVQCATSDIRKDLWFLLAECSRLHRYYEVLEHYSSTCTNMQSLVNVMILLATTLPTQSSSKVAEFSVPKTMPKSKSSYEKSSGRAYAGTSA